MQTKIQQIIIDSIKELNTEIGDIELDSPSLETHIYGSEGIFDSITLVSLIADIEDKVSKEFGINIVIADEKAMSQARSPFKSIGNLSEYIENLVAEAKNE